MRSLTNRCFVALVLLSSILIGMYRVNDSGALWQDSPRYANAAVMIHDWILSGKWTQPFEFARSFYSKYPGFSVPYHPPVYPAFLALFMICFGVKYWVMRLFVALCLSVAVLTTSAIANQLGGRKVTSFLSGILLLSMPEVVHWTRDTMSEVPALMLILVATFFFIRWLKDPRFYHCVLAVLFAELAFLSRVTTIGVIPGLFLFALLCGHWRVVFGWASIFCWGGYLVINTCWVIFVRQFARYELIENAASTRVEMFSPWHLAYYPIKSWGMLGPLTFCLVVIGIAIFVRHVVRRQLSKAEIFSFCWLLGYFGFQLYLCANEVRYFFFGLPGFAWLAGNVFVFLGSDRPRWVGAIGVAFCSLVFCGSNVINSPQGIWGYDAVAARLAREELGGNVLAACVGDQDLITRILCKDDERRFGVLRGDRVLALRLPGYAGVDAHVVAQTGSDVMRLLELGRVRYVVTFVADVGAEHRLRKEMKIAHDTVVSAGDRFVLLEKRSFHEMNGRENVTRGVLWLWRYTGELPDGPSELPVVIPTAGLEIKRAAER
ncbi:glycosyltransferase family 39 protein [bacterium]|nr:glycosyltransferase family 39 protein [bacterium]